MTAILGCCFNDQNIGLPSPVKKQILTDESNVYIDPVANMFFIQRDYEHVSFRIDVYGTLLRCFFLDRLCHRWCFAPCGNTRRWHVIRMWSFFSGVSCFIHYKWEYITRQTDNLCKSKEYCLENFITLRDNVGDWVSSGCHVGARGKALKTQGFLLSVAAYQRC